MKKFVMIKNVYKCLSLLEKTVERTCFQLYTYRLNDLILPPSASHIDN